MLRRWQPAPHSLGGDDQRGVFLVRLDRVDPEYGPEEDGPFFAWLPPEDRLWRHPSEAPEPQKPRAYFTDTRYGPKTWTVAVVAGMVGALAASGIGMASGAFRASTTRAPLEATSVATVAVSNPQPSASWTKLDDRTAPSVVGVSVSGPSGEETGSGVLLFGGYVVTDRSLLSLSGETTAGCCVDITFLTGRKVVGQLIGDDPLSGLAVIAVPATIAPRVQTGTVESIRETSTVIAVPARTSSPFAMLAGTISGESVRVALPEGADMDNLLAVSPALPSGTAGSPLVNQDGQVVGVTLSLDPMDTDAQNVTFAVPIDEAIPIAEAIVNHQQVFHPWLGVADANDVPASVSQMLGIAGGVTAGVIDEPSPASQAGIQPSDIIYAFDGQNVNSAGALTAVLDKCQPDRVTTISFIHDNKRQTRQIVVRNEPNDS